MTPVPARPLAFLDVESTGLEPDLHELWELAFILRAPGKDPIEFEAQMPVSLATADPMALEINRFWERHNQKPLAECDPAENRTLARQIAILLAGAVIIGSNPGFDVNFLDRWLRANSAAPTWHYRPVCVESLAAARLGVRPPWQASELGRLLGVVKGESQHTAMGDARWNMRMYDSVYAVPAQPVSDEPAVVDDPVPVPVHGDGPTPEDIKPAGRAPGLKRPSTTEPSECSNCGQPVDPRAALASFATMRKVLCMEPDGGCFGRETATPQEVDA